MTDTPPKPKRRRWRWLVALLLIAAAGIALNFRSPVDHRLIGRWQTGPQSIPVPHVVTFEFRDDGVLVEDTGFVGKTNSYWLMDGDTIVTHPNRPFDASTYYGQLWQWLGQAWSGAPPPRPPDAFKIVAITGNKLTLEYVGVRRWPAPTYLLTRLPE